MTKTKNTDQNVLALAAITLMVVIGLYVLLMKTKTNTINQQVVVQAPAIENKSGLDSVSKELDGQSLTNIDTELTKLNSDSNF